LLGSDANAIISAIAVRLGRDVQSFLLMPVKRGREIRDFLSDILRCCSPDHPDVPHLQRAVEQMQSIVEELNKRNKVESVLDLIANLPHRVKEMGVSVLREGTVFLTEGAGRLFLCSVCIILAIESVDEMGGSREQLTFLAMLEFKPSPPVVLSNTESGAAFDLQTSRGSTTVQVAALCVVFGCFFKELQKTKVKTVEERISWMQSIKTAIDAFLRKSSALNVFANRKDIASVSIPSGRSTSMTMSRKTGMMLNPRSAATSAVSPPISSKKMLTLGGRSKVYVFFLRFF
jgi:hypothetical protein